ncbi:hypothetical protein BG011_009312 [Mortierella polycephala]|uniref:Protein Zds1 C-terminal domain-containing protein n=1 Tax=Mortierella polycephala TaxID=41804 RepID=A0A9P6TWA6_9FUNG|nr:hypothetical protein BG011_009312 [Mortierella polycephala]
MSKENIESPTFCDSPQTEDTPVRARKQSDDSMVRNRREAIALDGLMFESSSGQEESSSLPLPVDQEQHFESTHMPACRDATGQGPLESKSRQGSADSGSVADLETGNQDIDNMSNMKDKGAPISQQSNLSTSSPSSPSASSTSTSTDSPPDSPSESKEENQHTAFEAREPTQQALFASNTLQADHAPHRSLSQSKRQSMFLGEHISITQHGPNIESPSSHSPGSNDDQEDMKEVEIETEDPSHLFWVPFHLHPEIAPNEYNKWLTKHGVNSKAADGIANSRSHSIARRKSVLSAQYNPEDDNEDQPTMPTKIAEADGDDFLSGVFSVPLEEMGEPPLKTKTSLRRSVSLSVSSPTRDHFPADAVEEDLVVTKRPGALERGGLSLLRRSARTKIRRNSTASNDTRTDVSRLRQTVNANGEYPAVTLVDPGPLPLPSTTQPTPAPTPIPTSSTTEDGNKTRKEGETLPLKRFVSTLRDSSKPTITTYIEPHLLEQQRLETEGLSPEKKEAEGTLSFRISAPGKLENTTAVRLLAETIENDRKEMPENFTVSYPIPPPVKLTQNLLQQPSSQSSPVPKTPSSSSQPSQQPSKQKHSGQAGSHGTLTHAKKPSTWSWLWGKEKEKGATDPSGSGVAAGSLVSKSNSVVSTQHSGAESNTHAGSSAEMAVKKQSTLSMLFSRNNKSTSSKSQATTAESSHSATAHGFHGQLTSSDKPKYSNYNRLPIHIERAIYRLSHVKLANPRRPLHEQVLISNMMFWYLGVIQQQQIQQQQADLQQQQQQIQLQQQAYQEKQEKQEHGKGSNSKDDKEPKSKSKPKKRKSQKKRNQQRGSAKSAERIVKSPEYEKQQQYQMNLVAQGPQQGTHPRSGNGSVDGQGWSDNDPRAQSNGQHAEYDDENQRSSGGRGGADYSDSYEESDGDDYLLPQQLEVGSRSDNLATVSIRAAPEGVRSDEEDDDVPLGHYQQIPRQIVPVS